jgi:hypothetical protein
VTASDRRRHERLARNEASFRRINERLESSLRDLGVSLAAEPFICECGAADCHEPVQLTLAEYEAVRANPTHFAVRPGHELTEIEKVVLERDRYSVVRKVGVGAGIAEAADPRG